MELKIVVIVACPTPNISPNDNSLQGSTPTYATDKHPCPAIPGLMRCVPGSSPPAVSIPGILLLALFLLFIFLTS
ncbi:hypothetical protein POPTR_007G082350v4 [Populus trichocarpa]|uniref:Phytosulfokine-beta n=1 Tax=Populus trichocarpa TaxID=3694 RepID=A0A2K1ZR84_POPTR|nr:hypothetical protein POPTR_007G082350v4 [Populus trichocarpa]